MQTEPLLSRHVMEIVRVERRLVLRSRLPRPPWMAVAMVWSETRYPEWQSDLGASKAWM